MKGACSVHTHSVMCDGKNTLAEMAQAAFQAGVVSFGASGHSHTPVPEDEGCVLPEDMTAYRKEVLRLRGEYAGGMDVLLGIELDSCADVTAEAFDYWIGSVHYLRDSEGNRHPVDWDKETLAAVSANVSANLLGLGNAATPLGIRAARRMAKGCGGTASDELCRLVVLNTASIQLVPATIASVRAAAGCGTPFDILPSVWLASALSVTAGLLAGWIFSRGRARP